MKKALAPIIILLISLIITLFVFEIMSWYHFGDIPTIVVLVRLIIFYVVTIFILSGIVWLIKRRKK